MSETDNEERAKSAKFQPSSFKSHVREDVKILDPDNPLLAKFQKALKEHLIRQIEHLKEDIFEYDCGIKKNNSKREEMGVLVYEQQQVVAKQQSTLDNYISKLQTASAAREELEHVLEEKREVYRKERDRLYETEAKEVDLRNEIEGTNLLIHQMSQYEDNLESDITVKQRIYEKTRKDKTKLIGEKRAQDALIYRLMTRIWQLEQELDKMEVQLRVKEEEREELAQTVALGNTNIEAMESEYRCLLHSWNSVIIAIGNRDKVLACLNGELGKFEEKFKSILSEAEQIKKLSQKEMKKNEEWTSIRDRFANDIQNCKAAMDVEMEKRMGLEKRLNEMRAIIEQMEMDIEKIGDETNDTNMLMASLRREYEQLSNQKSELEENILKFIEDQVTNDKTLLTLKRALKLLKAKNREMEIHVATIENKTACVACELESQRFINFESQQYLTDLDQQLKELGREADADQEELKKMDLKITARQREVDLLNNKHQRMVEKSGVAFSSPLETKISTLEKNIEEIQEQNKRLQQFWLREQTNLLKISEQRQEQIHTNNIMRKQILILEQKNLKVTDELDAHKKQQDKVLRAINNLHSQLTVMGDHFCHTRGNKTNMYKDNDVLRQDYVYKLKDAELECLKLEDEIVQIEDDKVTMSSELIDMNRQALEWEKKFLSAKETKSTMIEERSKGGEVETMKAEIHRMNVRYSQLKKVQDVLVQDLEHCVSRRDAILTVAEAREKRTKGGMEKTRFNFTRKLDDMKNKTKQMETQIAEMVKKMETIDRTKSEIEEKIKSVEDELEMTASSRMDLQRDIEESVTQRQMNFELLLQLQRKLNIYTDVSKGRKPHLLYRTESTLTSEYHKEIEVNSKLTKLVENLQTDFPNRLHELNRISNTLKLPVLVYYQ